MEELLEKIKKIRVDIVPIDNGEFIELELRTEEDGRFIRFEDLEKLLKELK